MSWTTSVLFTTEDRVISAINKIREPIPENLESISKTHP